MKIKHPIVIGIETHKATHVAVAIDTQGTRLAARSILATSKGYLELERWSCAIGRFRPLESKERALTVPVCRDLCSPKGTTLLRLRGPTIT